MLKKVGIAFFVKALGAIAAFLMSAVIARKLEATEAGYFFLGFTVLTILTSTNQFGTHLSSLKYIGAAHSEKKWDQIQKIANFTKLVVLLLACISAIGLWIAAPYLAHLWLKPSMQAILENTSWVIIVMSLNMIIGYHLQAIHCSVASITTLSIFTPLGLAFIVFIFNIDTGIKTVVALGYVASLNLIFSILLWKKHSNLLICNFPKDMLKILSTSWSLWVITLMNILTIWGSQFIAARWATAEEIAQLVIAQRTSMLVSFILIAVNLVFTPHFSALYHQNRKKELKELAIKSTRIMSFFSIPVVLVLILFPKSIMSFFGGDFAAGSHLLIILALGQLINTITGSVGQLLNMTGHEKDMRNTILVASPFAILLALILVPMYGVIGAAVSTALGVSLLNIGAVFMVKKRLGFNILKIW